MKAYGMLSFPMVWWGIFFLYAFIRAIYFSFTDLRFSVDKISTFNLDNYIRLFHDETFGKAIGNTAIWTVVMTIFNNVLGLLFAWLIFRMKKGRKLFLALLFWPTLVSAVVGAQVTKLLFNPSDSGVINSIIIACGGNPIGWYNDPKIALVTLMIVPSLLGFSTQMMIYYVALMGVPKSYAEAARLETNSQWTILGKVYLPLIRNAITYNMILSLIGNLKVIGPMQLVSESGKGGPLDSTMTIMLYLYNKGIVGYEMGYACAIGVITLLIILILSGIQLKLTGIKAVDYE
jgi:multiple sugar transport system permease protein